MTGWERSLCNVIWSGKGGISQDIIKRSEDRLLFSSEKLSVLMTFCLLLLSITNRRVLNFATIIGNLSISPLCSLIFFFHIF